MATNKTSSNKKASKLHLLAQYIKDLSFENIASTKGGNPDDKLHLDVKIDVDGARGSDNRASVGIRIRTEANTEKKDPMFVLDIEYIGIFRCEPNNSLVTKPFLLVKGPELIFPYVHRIITDITLNGGFPPVMLEPIDFEKLYHKRLALQKKQKEGGAEDDKELSEPL